MPESESESRLPGLVSTFYSYKGGVGRSMALANVGVLMAADGHRVLLVDWDLEAPGLEVFFRRAAKLVGDASATPGVVDLLESHAKGTPLPWRDCLFKAEFFGNSLDILSSGSRTGDYRRRVQQLDWDTLYREHQIGDYIDALRQQWRDEYDFVLIDSRTGVTDIGDICTVILPDILVLMFVTNYQNIEGIKSVMSRAVKARSRLPVNRSKLLGVPVPARDERYHEYSKSVEWQKIFADEFTDLYREWLPKNVSPEDALNRIFLPYVSGWSFGERIPVIESERERADPTSLGAAYARLAVLLSHRLDWTAIDAKASQADVAGARVELSIAREAAREAEHRLAEQAKQREEELHLEETRRREAELRAADEKKRREEEVRAEEAKRRELESALQEAQMASAKTRRRSRILSIASAVLLMAVGVGGWWYYTHPSAERVAARLSSADADVRLNAVYTLNDLTTSEPGVSRFAPELVRLLKDSEYAVRSAAALSLGNMGENGAMFASEVAALLKDSDSNVRRDAASSLGRMGENGAMFAPEVAALLRDTDDSVRWTAASSLGRMGENGAMFASEVAALLKDGSSQVRRDAAEALGNMGKPAAKFVPDVAALLKDGNAGVRAAAAEALKKLGEQEAKR